MFPRLLPALLCPLLLLVPTTVASGSVAGTDPSGDQIGRVERTTLLACEDPATDIVRVAASSDGATLTMALDVLDASARPTCEGLDVGSRRRSAGFYLFPQDPAFGVVRVDISVQEAWLEQCTLIRFHDADFRWCEPTSRTREATFPLQATVSTSKGPRTYDLSGATMDVTFGAYTLGSLAPGVSYSILDWAAAPAITA